jgi:hypothetical protein
MFLSNEPDNQHDLVKATPLVRENSYSTVKDTVDGTKGTIPGFKENEQEVEVTILVSICSSIGTPTSVRANI